MSPVFELKSLLSLNKYLLRHKSYLVAGTFFIIASNVFAIAVAPLVRMAIDELGESLKLLAAASDPAVRDQLGKEIGAEAFKFAALILGSALIKGVFMYYMRQTIIVMSRYIEYDLKNDIYDQYQRLGPGFYGRNFTGDLMNRISEDVSRVRMYLGPAIMYTFNLVVLFVMVIAFMLSINARITFWVLLPLPFLSLSIYYVSDLINQRSDAIQKKLSELTSYVQEAFSGIRVLKSFAVEGAFSKNFEKESEDYQRNYMHLVKVDALFFPLMVMLVGCSVIITVWVGGKAVMRGEFSYGNIAEYIIYVNMLTWPVASLGWVTSLVQRAAASQSRIDQFLHETPELEDTGEDSAVFDQEIEFKNLGFSYHNGNEVLHGLHLKIRKGEILAVVGQTGSGKTSLARVLTRMYDPQSGEVLLDGKNIRAYRLASYRKLFGYVPQDMFLFQDSILRNILYGLPEEQHQQLAEKARECACLADVLEDIEDFPEGFETVIGERGVTLSGGQKQRVSIARALAIDPEILVLDDSLSAVDVATEKMILTRLKEYLNGKTALWISHRVSMAEYADRIAVLHQGAIAEIGSHEELLMKGGMYAAMYQQQRNSPADADSSRSEGAEIKKMPDA